MDKPSAKILPEEVENVALDSARHLAYSAVQKPISAISQICGGKELVHTTEFMQKPTEAPFGSGLWHAEQVAANVGAIVPFLASLTLVRGGAGKLGLEKQLFKSASEGSASSLAFSYRTAEMTAAGALNGGVFEPSEGDNLLSARLHQATVSGVTMGVMHRLSNKLSSFTGASSPSASPFNKAFTAYLAGTGGGITGLITEGAISGGNFPDDPQSIYKSVYAAGWAGASLSLIGGSSSKLHQPKSTMRELETYAARTSKGFDVLDTSAEVIISDSILGKGKVALMKLNDRLTSTEVDAKPAMKFANLSPAERVDLIGLMESKASSSFINGNSLAKVCDSLMKKTESWNRDALKQTQAEVAEKNKVVEEAINEYDRIKSQNFDLYREQFGHLSAEERVKGSSGFVKELEVEEIAARTKKDKALAFWMESVQKEDKLLAERVSVLEAAANEFLKENNLPPVKFEVSSLGNRHGFYQPGVIAINRPLLASERITPKQLEVIMHELVHHEQDVKQVRLMADRLGLTSANEASVKSLETAFGNLEGYLFTSRSSGPEPHPSSAHRLEILRMRNGNKLDARGTSEAGRYLQAVQNYRSEPMPLQKTLTDAYCAILNLESRNPYQLLKEIREQPKTFKNRFALFSIPKSLRELAESTNADTTNNFSAEAVKSARKIEEKLSKDIATALEPQQKRLEKALDFYGRLELKRYLVNGLEQPAWAAGALAGAAAELAIGKSSK